MDSEILLALKSISVEEIVIAFVVFTLTMFIKIPIKKFSSKFVEDKRKAINTIIVLVPAIISLILSILYCGILKGTWFKVESLEFGFSVYILSLTVYAIYSRVVNIVKSFKSGTLDSEILQDNFEHITENLELLESALKNKQSTFNDIVLRLNQLQVLKSSIEESKTQNSLISLEDIKTNISSLISQKESLEDEIKTTQQQIKKLEKTNEKGEING